MDIILVSVFIKRLEALREKAATASRKASDDLNRHLAGMRRMGEKVAFIPEHEVVFTNGTRMTVDQIRKSMPPSAAEELLRKVADKDFRDFVAAPLVTEVGEAFGRRQFSKRFDETMHAAVESGIHSERALRAGVFLRQQEVSKAHDELDRLDRINLLVESIQLAGELKVALSDLSNPVSIEVDLIAQTNRMVDGRPALDSGFQAPGPAPVIVDEMKSFAEYNGISQIKAGGEVIGGLPEIIRKRAPKRIDMGLDDQGNGEYRAVFENSNSVDTTVKGDIYADRPDFAEILKQRKTVLGYPVNFHPIAPSLNGGGHPNA